MVSDAENILEATFYRIFIKNKSKWIILSVFGNVSKLIKCSKYLEEVRGSEEIPISDEIIRIFL